MSIGKLTAVAALILLLASTLAAQAQSPNYLPIGTPGGSPHDVPLQSQRQHEGWFGDTDSPEFAQFLALHATRDTDRPVLVPLHASQPSKVIDMDEDYFDLQLFLMDFPGTSYGVQARLDAVAPYYAEVTPSGNVAFYTNVVVDSQGSKMHNHGLEAGEAMVDFTNVPGISGGKYILSYTTSSNVYEVPIRANGVVYAPLPNSCGGLVPAGPVYDTGCDGDPDPCENQDPDDCTDPCNYQPGDTEIWSRCGDDDSCPNDTRACLPPPCDPNSSGSADEDVCIPPVDPDDVCPGDGCVPDPPKECEDLDPGTGDPCDSIPGPCTDPPVDPCDPPPICEDDPCVGTPCDPTSAWGSECISDVPGCEELGLEACDPDDPCSEEPCVGTPCDPNDLLGSGCIPTCDDLSPGDGTVIRPCEPDPCPVMEALLGGCNVENPCEENPGLCTPPPVPCIDESAPFGCPLEVPCTGDNPCPTGSASPTTPPSEPCTFWNVTMLCGSTPPIECYGNWTISPCEPVEDVGALLEDAIEDGLNATEPESVCVAGQCPFQPQPASHPCHSDTRLEWVDHYDGTWHKDPWALGRQANMAGLSNSTMWNYTIGAAAINLTNYPTGYDYQGCAHYAPVMGNSTMFFSYNVASIHRISAATGHVTLSYDPGLYYNGTSIPNSKALMHGGSSMGYTECWGRPATHPGCDSYGNYNGDVNEVSIAGLEQFARSCTAQSWSAATSAANAVASGATSLALRALSWPGWVVWGAGAAVSFLSPFRPSDACTVEGDWKETDTHWNHIAGFEVFGSQFRSSGPQQGIEGVIRITPRGGVPPDNTLGLWFSLQAFIDVLKYDHYGPSDPDCQNGCWKHHLRTEPGFFDQGSLWIDS